MPDNRIDREGQILEATRIIGENSAVLRKWLKAEKLDITDAVSSVHNGTWASSLRSRGLLDVANDWLAMQKERLTVDYPVTGHKRVAREVAWRFSMAKMMQSSGGLKKVPKPTKADETETACLPAQLLWVYEHPALSPPPGVEADDPALTAQVAAYEKANKAPGQGAINYLNHCKSDKTARQKMFDEVRTFLLENRKKRKDPTETEQDQKEKSRILDMKAELAKMTKTA